MGVGFLPSKSCRLRRLTLDSFYSFIFSPVNSTLGENSSGSALTQEVTLIFTPVACSGLQTDLLVSRETRAVGLVSCRNEEEQSEEWWTLLQEERRLLQRGMRNAQQGVLPCGRWRWIPGNGRILAERRSLRRSGSGGMLVTSGAGSPERDQALWASVFAEGRCVLLTALFLTALPARCHALSGGFVRFFGCTPVLGSTEISALCVDKARIIGALICLYTN